MTLEEEIKLGLHGNHCKVIEEMLIETVRKTREQSTNQIALNMIQDGKLSLDEIAAVLDIPMEKVQDLVRQEKGREIERQKIIRQIEELKKKLDEIDQKRACQSCVSKDAGKKGV